MTALVPLAGRRWRPCGRDEDVRYVAAVGLALRSGAAAVYATIVARHVRAVGVTVRPDRAALASLAAVSSDLFVRTAALRVSFTVATAVAARIGVVELAAHQVAFEIWTFLALVLDAIAIAGQAMVGRLLGAGDGSGARAASRRMLEWGAGRSRSRPPASTASRRWPATTRGCASTWTTKRSSTPSRLARPPTCPRGAPSRADVLVRDTGDRLYTRRGTGWGGRPGKTWAGGALTSDPAAVSWGPNRVNVFASGLDNALWQDLGRCAVVRVVLDGRQPHLRARRGLEGPRGASTCSCAAPTTPCGPATSTSSSAGRTGTPSGGPLTSDPAAATASRISSLHSGTTMCSVRRPATSPTATRVRLLRRLRHGWGFPSWSRPRSRGHGGTGPRRLPAYHSLAGCVSRSAAARRATL